MFSGGFILPRFDPRQGFETSFFLSQHPEYDVKSPGISFEIITASLLAEIFCKSKF